MTTRILFVCHGNICRSPMAEFVMKALVKSAGIASAFEIDSAATSTEELGRPVYPAARRMLSQHGITDTVHSARQMTRRDYDSYDLIIGMDHANIRSILRICGGDPSGKVHLLMDYTDRRGEVADPWYTDDFDAVWRDISDGCSGLFAAVTRTASED